MHDNSHLKFRFRLIKYNNDVKLVVACSYSILVLAVNLRLYQHIVKCYYYGSDVLAVILSCSCSADVLL